MRIRLTAEEGWLSLEVSDNGIGVSQETLMNTRSLGVVGMRERARIAGGELTIGNGPVRGTLIMARFPNRLHSNVEEGSPGAGYQRVVMIRVLITDDHPIVRRGLKQIVADQLDMTVAEAGNGPEALRLADTGKFDLVLLHQYARISGLDVLSQIRYRQPLLPVLVLSAHPEAEFAVRIIKASAPGYLNKHLAPEELVTAIRRVISGQKYVSPAVAELIADSIGKDEDEPHASLSDREYQVMLLIAAGKTVSEIAEEIALSVKTVSTYRSRILEKMNLKNNAELMRYVIENKVGR